MCRVDERDNINSRNANSGRAVRGNINGEVPVIATVPRGGEGGELIVLKNLSITRGRRGRSYKLDFNGPPMISRTLLCCDSAV